MGMGLVWCVLYALTACVGIVIIGVIGKSFGMDTVYGSLIPFAFTQGPGQAASFGAVYEQFGLAKNCGEIDSTILKGYYKKEEQPNHNVTDTTYNGNIESMGFHFAIIGLCYVGAIGISKLFALVPGFIGQSMGGLLFFNGMLAAYVVKFLMKKFKVDFMLDDGLLNKVTGWTSDYLVVCAFMAISFNVIGKWMAPICIEAAIVTAITVIVCFYFGKRFGGSNDFERTLGLYGTSTGTIPSGIALTRIVDPEFKTTTSIELGLMTLVMMLTTPMYIILPGFASGQIPTTIALGASLALVIIYLIIMKVTKCWGKKTYSWK